MIEETEDYELFTLLKGNRVVDLKHARSKELVSIMRKYGWLEAFPLMVTKEGKKFKVLDGQHRLAVAKKLGIPVKYVVCKVDIDVAKLNATSKSWSIKDYIHRYMAEDNEHYNTLWVFYQRYGLPISICIELLSGGYYSGKDTRNGDFKVSNTARAREVADCATYLKTLNSGMSLYRMARAISMCLNVEGFDKVRFLENAEKCSHQLRKISGTLEDSLEVMEDIYNKWRQNKMPLKFEAIAAGRIFKSSY